MPTTFFSAATGYNGTVHSAYGSSPLTITSGALFCSIPVTSCNGVDLAGGQNGVWVAYRQQKSWTTMDDSASIVFVGRKKPVSEYGIFRFRSGQFSFGAPPPGYLFSTSVAYDPRGTWSDHGDGAATDTAASAAFQAIVKAQHAGSLCGVADARGRIYFGSLTPPQITDDADGWTTISCSFYEAGTG